MKKSARVSEKLASPGLPGLQVATRQTSTNHGHRISFDLIISCVWVRTGFVRQHLECQNLEFLEFSDFSFSAWDSLINGGFL